jgi:hypothetical protein
MASKHDRIMQIHEALDREEAVAWSARDMKAIP